MKCANFIFVLLLIDLLTLSFNKEILNEDYVSSDIEITEKLNSTEIYHNEKIHLFNASFDKKLGKFIFLEMTSKNINEYNHIFVSIPGDEEVPNYINSDYKTVDKNTALIIETKNILDGVTSGKIAIECKFSCEFTFSFQIVNTISLFDDRSFDLILNPNEEFTLEYEISQPNELNNKFTFFSNSPTDFDIKILYGEDSLQPLKEFYNGYGFLVNENLYKEGINKIVFKLSHYQKPNELVHVSNRKLTSEKNSLSVGDFHSSIVGTEQIINECFDLPIVAQEQNDKNYNLNFLSYTKNILVSLTKNDSALNEEYKIISESEVIQFDAKSFDQMCLSSLDGKIATTTFQLLDGTEQTINQDAQMPLYRGVPRKAKLTRGELAYYKLNFYQPYSAKIFFNLKSIKGNTKLYYGVCTNYPNCNFNPEQLSSLDTEKDINGNTYFSKNIETNMTKPYSDPQFQTAIVYCEKEEDDCEYYITLSNDNDRINIIENQKFYGSLTALAYNKYQFDIYDNNNDLGYLYLELYTYSGLSNLYLFSDAEMTKEITFLSKITTFGNKEYLLLNAQNLPEKSLNGKFYVKVKAITNSTHSINYSTVKKDLKPPFDTIIPSGEVNLEGLSINDGVQSFLIKNEQIDKNYPFSLEFNGLNCNLSVSFTGESKIVEARYHRFVIDSSKEYYSNDYYELRIKVLNLDIENSYKDALCLFTINGNNIVSNENREIVINDGIIQKGHLDQEIKTLNYLYVLKPQSDFNRISIDIMKNSDEKLLLSYSFGPSEKFINTFQIKPKEKRILFQKEDFYSNCQAHYDSYCVLKLQIESESQEIDFSLNVNDAKPNPIYLNKGEITQNILQTNQYQYYYFDIAQYKSADVFVDFTYGHGQAVFKLVSKANNETGANFNRRVVLPEYGMPNTHNLDQFSKFYTITSEMTEICEKGCELYIGVFHSEQKYKEKIGSYNIYYRINSNEILNLKENINAHGVLKNNKDDNDYRTEITKDSDKVIFNINSENATVYINLGSELPSRLNYEYVLKSSDKEQSLIIQAKDIGKTTFKGEIFSYIVTTENSYGQQYDIRLEIPEKNIVNIKEIDYLHNNPCFFNSENSKCHYLLPVNSYSLEDKLFFFVPDDSNVLVYAKSISMEEYDILSPEEKQKQLPLKPESGSSDSLIFDISGRKKETDIKKKEIYVLITVENNDISIEDLHNKATLAIGEYYTSVSTPLRPNLYNFFSLNKNTLTDLYIVIEGKDLYKATFVLINNGKGTIQQSQLEKKVFNLNENENKVLTFMLDPEDKNEKLLSVKIDPESTVNEFNFYVILESRTNLYNFDEIIYTELNEQKFEYLQNKENDKIFPLFYYQKISQKKNNYHDEQFIIQISDRLPLNISFSKLNLTVNGYIVNKDFINQKKGDKEIQPSFSKFVGFYDAFSLTARVKFLKENIEKEIELGNDYFYIEIIENEKKNEIKLEYFEVYFVKSNFEFIDNNVYTMHALESEQTKTLLLVPEMGVKQMAVDFMTDALNLGTYTISINQYFSDNDDYSKNSTYLIKSDTFVNGKKTFRIYINQNIHYIVFNVIRLKKSFNEDTKTDSCLIRYRVEETDPAYYVLKNREVKTSLDGTKLTINFNGVLETESGDPHDTFQVKYVLNMYDKKTLGGKSNINSIWINETALSTENKIFVGKESKGSLSLTTNIKENDGKEQIGHLLAYAKYKEDEDIFSYSSFEIIYKKEKTTDRTFEFWIILVSFCATIVISFGVVFVYLFAHGDAPRLSLFTRPANNDNNITGISSIQRPTDSRYATSGRMTI